MTIREVREALDRIAKETGSDQLQVIVQLHPSIMFNATDNVAATREVELLDEGKTRYAVVFISNTVGRY